jgi:nucleotide-binding universal stress UspA family protein
MVACQRPDGDLDPWKEARERATMDHSLGRPGAPQAKENEMSLSTHVPRPTAVTSDEAVTPRTIVVGYDASDEARAAVAVAIDRAEPSDRILLVHATAPASNWLGTPYYDRAVARIHEAAQRVLDEMRPIAEQVETPIEFSVLEGPPAAALIRAAAAREADEIVVGSRGLGRIRGALGSVSQELLREAARPVLVVTRDAAAVRGALPSRG